MTSSEDTAAELAGLRAENEELKAALHEEAHSAGHVRSFILWALIVVGCLSAAAAAVGLWARTTALDTDTYVETVAPLPQNPAVSAALAQTIVDEVFRDVDIEQELQQLLPEQISFLAAPVGSAVGDLSVDIADGIISSDAFQAVWESLNRLAHSKAVAVLTGRGTIVLTQEGEVTLDLTEAASAVRTGLEEAGLGDLLPEPRQEGAAVVLFSDQQLGVLQLTVDLLDVAFWGLPIFTILTLGAAVFLSRNRRGTWMAIGIGLAIAMAASLLFLDLARGAVVDGIEDPVAQAGIISVWDQLFRNLTNLQAALLMLSLIIAVTAFLIGPHRWAVSFRQGVGRRVDSWRTHDRAVSVQGDRLGTFLTEHLAAMRLFGVVAALLFMLVWPRLTVGIVLVTVSGLIIFLGLVELARSHRPSAVPSGDLVAIDLTDAAAERSEDEEPATNQPK